MPVQRAPIDFAPQAKEYTAKQLNAQVCKNWYGNIDESAAFKKVLFPFPGSDLWSDDSGLNDNVRGMYSLNGYFYAVIDDEFRIYNDNGDWNKVGTLKTAMGIVKFMANDNQIFVTDYQFGYIYQLVTTSSRTAGTFFQITNASSDIGKVTFLGSGMGTGELSALGTFTGSNDRRYYITIDGQSLSSITTPIFTGTGKNDPIVTSGIYNGLVNKNFVVQIDGLSTTDTFKWSNNGGVTWAASTVPVSLSPITLQDGIKIVFKFITGHTMADSWSFTGNAAGTEDTFKWSNDGGTTFTGQNIPITSFDQPLDDGIIIKFVHTSGYTKNDSWIFDVTIDDVFYPPITPIYLDTYGVFPKSNTERFYISDIEDFSSVNALDYASTNAFPDNVVCGIAINQEIFFIGNYTTEVWIDAGTSPFPFQRRPNLLINWGTKAPYSLASASNNVVFWLAQNINGGRVVVMLVNYQAHVISDKPLNDKLQEYDYIDDAFGFVCEWTGKIFYFLTFPSQDITWVYDFDSQAWRQRTTVRAPNDVKDKDYIEGRYLANCHVYHNGEHYIGDWQSGKIYRMSGTYFKDGLMPIINEAISAPLHVNLNRIAVYSLQPALEAAVGLVSGQGSDPIVMLQYSTDGGYSWSKEIHATVGKVGETMRRCKFNKLGFGREFVFKIRISDPIYKVLKGAIVEIEDTGS